MGVGSLAGLLRAKGFEISGSDQYVYPPMSTQLESLGIKLFDGYKPENLFARWEQGPDLVIVGNAVSKNNPEVLALLEKKIPYLSMPQSLKSFFLEGKESLVVAGTHGKTTSASLLAWLLHAAGRDPGFLIGGILGNFGQSYGLGSGPQFVVEGDEYDTAFFDKEPKFVHYQPAKVLLGPVEFDHADIYKDLDHLLLSFEKLIHVLKPDGLLMACADSANTLGLAQKFKGRVMTYGVGDSVEAKKADLRAERLEFSAEGVQFDLLQDGKKWGVFKSPLSGRHNVQNLLSSIGILLDLGVSVKDIQAGLNTFKGVKRRQEVRGTVADVIVLDDFAHHPTAVEETIDAVRARYKGYHLWAVFEPRSNTSQRAIFQKPFAEALSHADRVTVAKLFRPEKVPEGERLDTVRLCDDIKAKGIQAEYLPCVAEIVNLVRNEIQTHTVLLVMSNGGFDGIHEKALKALKERFHP